MSHKKSNQQFVSQPSSGGSSGCSVGATPDVVAFDEAVFGRPHIFDSVVLTDLSIDAGLLGSHIADLCSGVIDDVILSP